MFTIVWLVLSHFERFRNVERWLAWIYKKSVGPKFSSAISCSWTFLGMEPKRRNVFQILFRPVWGKRHGHDGHVYQRHSVSTPMVFILDSCQLVFSQVFSIATTFSVTVKFTIFQTLQNNALSLLLPLGHLVSPFQNDYWGLCQLFRETWRIGFKTEQLHFLSIGMLFQQLYQLFRIMVIQSGKSSYF